MPNEWINIRAGRISTTERDDHQNSREATEGSPVFTKILYLGKTRGSTRTRVRATEPTNCQIVWANGVPEKNEGAIDILLMFLSRATSHKQRAMVCI